jgi:4-aminobutyrate aminotransferase-like enzyme/Ser/Thr protein kinase RdoA (MazF antagonist)
MDQAAPQTLMGLASDPPDISAEQASATARDLFGLDGTVEPKRGERDRNFRIRATDRRDVILKFCNDAEDPAVIDMQTQALRHIADRGAEVPVPRVIPALDGETVSLTDLSDGRRLMVWAMSYLPGKTLWECDRTPALLRDVGAVLAETDIALRGFFHPAANQCLAWDLMQAGEVAGFADLIKDAGDRQLVAGVLDRFCGRTVPMLKGLRGQIIHNDGNLGNVLAETGDKAAVTGLIDFGDMVHGPLIAELAVAGGDVVLETADPMGSAAALVAGYHSVLPLEADELAVLFDGILARLAVTLAIHAWRWEQSGGAAPADIAYEEPCRRALQDLASVSHEDAERLFRRACGMVPAEVQPATTTPVNELVERRHRVLGRGLSLSYSEPLHIVRGEGVWLYDGDGRAYLDAYNNVAHVGHCHPQVVAAIAGQSAQLNTNTRYLHSTVLDYAERLTRLMPDGLDVCVFVNSGSEANDIAWRMAKAFTGQDGALIMENAYHGGTDAVVALSPEEFETPTLRSHIRTIEAPDTYRGRLRGDVADAGSDYAGDADRAIGELEAAGHGLAAFMVDSGFTSNGILDVPAGYGGAVAAKVHAAGGVVIGDEVQYGFGRPGSHFWGFDLLQMPLDIVTLGKPIGNGHPLGVVVTRRDILEAFNRDAGYFSTFGGNPVSCAAGLAVLDVLESEQLQHNAAQTGAYLVEGLRALQQKHQLIGDVRGSGLIAGVELVRDRATREPAARERDQVLDLMKNRGVLVGRTGELGNIVKIRPPMPFGRAHADHLIAAMDDALAELE